MKTNKRTFQHLLLVFLHILFIFFFNFLFFYFFFFLFSFLFWKKKKKKKRIHLDQRSSIVQEKTQKVEDRERFNHFFFFSKIYNKIKYNKKMKTKEETKRRFEELIKSHTELSGAKKKVLSIIIILTIKY